jgi:hypothetical protein
LMFLKVFLMVGIGILNLFSSVFMQYRSTFTTLALIKLFQRNLTFMEIVC